MHLSRRYDPACLSKHTKVIALCMYPACHDGEMKGMLAQAREACTSQPRAQRAGAWKPGMSYNRSLVTGSSQIRISQRAPALQFLPCFLQNGKSVETGSRKWKVECQFQASVVNEGKFPA